MGVRTKVKITFGGAWVISNALVNSGYETDQPEILIPEVLARKRLKVNIKKGKKIRYIAVAGTEPELFIFEQKAKVQVLTDDKRSKTVQSILVVSPGEEEVIISDALIDELGIEVLKFHEGKWRFVDDPTGKVRYSEKRELWI